jgi:hypothetical protein
MTELERTSEPVRLSAMQAALWEAGIESFVFDAEAGALFGGAIRARLMVADDDAARARRVLTEAGLEPRGKG